MSDPNAPSWVGMPIQITRHGVPTGDVKPIITVTRSAGADNAWVVFIDTTFEPDGSDGGPGLRVLVNDSDTYIGVPYENLA